MRRSAAIVFTLLVAVAGVLAQQPVSRYTKQTREQSQRVETVANELMEMIRQSEEDPNTIVSVGRRFLAECDRALEVAKTYRDADTRFGLQSEVDDFYIMVSSLRKGNGSFQKLTGVGPAAYATAEMQATYSLIDEDIVPMIKGFVDMEMNAQGLGDFLTDPGFEKAGAVIKNRIESEIRTRIEDEIKQIIGVRISVGHSLRSHIMLSARSWVSTKIHGLVFRIAVNSFVVELLGKKVLDWIGPELKEFLRHKGSLQLRVNRTLEKMRDREIRLNGMKSEQDLSVVRNEVESAMAHINTANASLRGDLKAAGNDDLYQELVKGETRLMDVVKLTRTRFLMNSPLAKVAFEDLVDVLVEIRDNVKNSLETYAAKVQGGQAPSSGSASYRGFATATFARDFKGEYKASLTAKGTGFMIHVTDPEGRLIANGEVERDPGYVHSSLVRFENDKPIWPTTGSRKAQSLMMSANSKTKTNAGHFNSFTLTWTGTDGRGILILTFQVVEQAEEGIARVFKGSENALYNRKYWGTYTAELSRSSGAYHLRVIGPRGDVIENHAMKPDASQTDATFDGFSVANPAWPPDAPAGKLSMKVLKRASDPSKVYITLTWYSKQGSRIFAILLNPSK